jgi:hypothetical protein
MNMLSTENTIKQKKYMKDITTVSVKMSEKDKATK